MIPYSKFSIQIVFPNTKNTHFRLRCIRHLPIPSELRYHGRAPEIRGRGTWKPRAKQFGHRLRRPHVQGSAQKEAAPCALPRFPTPGFGRRPTGRTGATEGKISTTSQQAGEPTFGIGDVIAKVSQVAFGKATVRGFRGLASTVLNESGLFEPDWVEHQLAHTPQGVRASYNSARYLGHRRGMMQWRADFLETAERRSRIDSRAAPERVHQPLMLTGESISADHGH